MNAGPPVSDRERTQFSIEGMSCAACAARIESALKDLPGVEAAYVNFATASSLVRHTSQLDASAIVQIVTQLGYQVHDNADKQSIQESHEAALKRRATPALLIAAFAMITMFIQFPASRWILASLSTFSVWWAGWSFHRSARVQIAQRALAMDTLVSLGTIAAWGWSMVVLISDANQNLHFGGATSIIGFVLLGKWWEARAMRASGDSLRALANMAPKWANLRDGTAISAQDLVVGMEFIVAPGERVATDGEVIEGLSSVDASQSTGESTPIEVAPGSEVAGGALNGDGALVVKVTAVGEDTELARVARLVEEAQATQAPIQRLADKVAAKFVPFVLGVAFGTFVIRWLLGHGINDALIAAVAVLVVSCPCAFGLATPLAVLVGTGRAAELGVVVAGAHVLDSSRAVDTVVFDKTGTITDGRPSIIEANVPSNQEVLFSLAGTLESRSGHPLSRAFDSFRDVDAEVKNFISHPGKGITGLVNEIEFRVGKAELFDKVPPELVLANSEGTLIYLGRGATAEGVVLVGDQIRPTSAEAIQLLRNLKLHVILLSGDRHSIAQQVGQVIGIEDVVAEVLPEEKQTHISTLQSEGRCVAMVGDGVNDTPALAAADLGIALQSGTDVARNVADITVMTDDPRAVADGIALSRRTLTTVKTNLAWAFSYNLVALPLALTGTLSPTQAAVAMALSSFLVVINSMRLRKFSSLHNPVP
ncbi:MAG TPA: cadmium-translocating P-type ATPase [Acidimicrobiaceae bacterium]|nr:cadmium-translocating P-type ATPase [Acidimicrobiaceae bacterium]|tara:strand:+ start:5866 stop:7992 length:2127 start_codon:yes stop_codon:yes gene_type:complete